METRLRSYEYAKLFGEGSSPTLYKDRLIVPWDHEGQSAIYAPQQADGRSYLEDQSCDEPTSGDTFSGRA